MRVLYVDGVGPFGGASRSLYEVVRAMPEGSVEPLFVVQRGTILDFYGPLASDVIATRGLTRFDNTRYGHYRGARWLVLLRELAHAPYTLIALLRARRRWGHVDVVHANEVTEILPALLAKRLFRAPLVVHVRSLQRAGDRSLRTRWVESRLRDAVDVVVAIDENVRATLPRDVPVDVIHNSFTAAHAASPDPALLERLAPLRSGALIVGFVGNLHLSKGLYDLLEAARLVRDAGRDVEFVVVGGTTRSDKGLKGRLLTQMGFAQNVHAEVAQRIEAAGLTDCFHLLGPTKDIQRVYERIDVLCFPSHFDAPGRPVFEAAFSGVPSIVAVTRPMPDTLVDGVTGVAVPARDPARLAQAILHFADDRAAVARMGLAARALAERNFDPRRNAARLLAVYTRLARARRVRSRRSAP